MDYQPPDQNIKMTKLVCLKDDDAIYHEMQGFIICDNVLRFLDKRNSTLIIRIKKGSERYEHHIKKNLSNVGEYSMTCWVVNNEMIYFAIYNKRDDYFVEMNMELNAIEWRTHPDFIAYVEKIIEHEGDEWKWKIVETRCDCFV